MEIKIVILVILAILAGYLYRRGGADWGGSRLWREAGVPACFLGACITLHMWHWSVAIAAALLGLTLTTYNKWVDDIFGMPHQDVYWPAWTFTGLSYGLALLPWAYCTHHWPLFWLRTAALTIFVPVWCALIKEVNLSEGGRGAAIITSLLILAL